MSKYEELKYVLSGATDWGYEYAKKEDVEAAFAELEERHAMELDQWVLELGKIKLENERLKKLLFNAQKAASDAKLSAHEKSRRIDELKAENEMLKQKLKDLQEYTTEEVNELCVEKENVWQLEKAWDLDKARIKELEAENESLKYSVATLDTDINMEKVKKEELLKKYVKRLQELAEKEYPDEEEDHGEADGILCEMLDAMGCNELTEAWDKINKWYS